MNVCTHLRIHIQFGWKQATRDITKWEDNIN
jgi:hypothetical protein